MCLSRNSYASYWSFSVTFSNFLLAEIQLDHIEFILRCFEFSLAQILLHGNRNVVIPFQNVPLLNFNCIVPKILSDIFKFVLAETQLLPIWSIIGRFPHVSQPKFDCILLKTFSNIFSLCVLAENQLLCTENILRDFKTVSRQKFNCIVAEFF